MQFRPNTNLWLICIVFISFRHFLNVDGPSQAVKHNLWLGKSPSCRVLETGKQTRKVSL